MQRSKFAAKREKGQASLFSFGIGQRGVDGRVPISESQSKGEREEEEDSALLTKEPENPKRRPGRPLGDKTANHSEAAARAEVQKQGAEASGAANESAAAAKAAKGTYVKYSERDKQLILGIHNEMGVDPRKTARHLMLHFKAYLPVGVTEDAIRRRIQVATSPLTDLLTLG